MERDDAEKARMELPDKSRSSFLKLVRTLQREAYDLLADWIDDSIELTENRIKFSASNFASVAGLFRLFKDFGKSLKQTLAGNFLEATEATLEANSAYFKTFANVTDVEGEARHLVLLRWGYDNRAKELIAGGYLDNLFSTDAQSRKVAALLNQAIGAKMPLDKFRQALREAFVGKPGEGMLERHFKTNTFDLFQRLDRTANLIYADKLGLDDAVYSHTFEEDSRDWCIKHGNKVFSRAEISDWSNHEWKGKNGPVYDPFIDCGGYNCRGHWSFVSKGIAEHLRAQQQ